MKEQLLSYFKLDKHNYHPLNRLELKFGSCLTELKELVSEGLIVERNGVNNLLYKLK